jgi:enoyl-CoA hydratase
VLLTARTFDGTQAYEAGLVDDVVHAGDEPAAEAVTAAAIAYAADIARLAPLAVQGAKRSIQEVVDHMSDEPSAAVRALVAEAYGSRDLQEGLAAMSEKRPPNFEGR